MPRFAGILPYAQDAVGNLYLLLAKEFYGRDKGAWSGFAGRVEARDKDALAVAAREGFEESSGLLGSEEDLLRILPEQAHAVQCSGGMHFLYPVQYVPHLPVMFNGVRDALCRVYGNVRYSALLEKDEIRWFTADELTGDDPALRLRSCFATDVDRILLVIRAT